MPAVVIRGLDKTSAGSASIAPGFGYRAGVEASTKEIEMPTPPTQEDLDRARPLVAVKAANILLRQLYADMALREPDPLGYIRTLEDRLKAATDRATAEPIGTLDGEFVKHAVLSQIEAFLRDAEAAIRATLDNQHGVHRPSGPATGM